MIDLKPPGIILLSMLFFLSAPVSAKPDMIDGNNYPGGRIPQEIKDNKYPRTYYPNTEKDRQ